MKIVSTPLRHLRRHWLALASLALVAYLMASALIPGPGQLVFAALALTIAGLWIGTLAVEAHLSHRAEARANARWAEERAATIAQAEKAGEMLDAVFKAYLDALSTKNADALARLSDLHKTCQAIQYPPVSEPRVSAVQGPVGELAGAS